MYLEIQIFKRSASNAYSQHNVHSLSPPANEYKKNKKQKRKQINHPENVIPDTVPETTEGLTLAMAL